MMKTRIRMYRPGLGDCFLLSFWPEGTQRATSGAGTHVLIDCGVLVGTRDASARMTRIVEAIRRHTGGQLHALVGTHEHWDHISGFNQAREVFDQISVEQIWLAWTEDPADDQATQLREGRKLRAQAIRQALSVWKERQDPGSEPLALSKTEGLVGFLGEAAIGKLSTADALNYLLSRPCRDRQFLEPGRTFELPGLGVRVFVLGPPRDETLLDKDLPDDKHPETYHFFGRAVRRQPDEFFALGHLAPMDSDGWLQPFDEEFRISEEQAELDPFFQARYGQGAPPYRRIDTTWLQSVEQLALKLDNDTNNTSLVLAFELGDGGDVILMAADAQVGNWLSWESVAFKYRVGGELRTVTAHDLLRRVRVYKVGHHGSHNATLKEKGLELMTDAELVALIPVDRTMAEEKNWKMPFGPLEDRLRQRACGRVLRLDDGVPRKDALKALHPDERRAFRDATTETPEWLDYWIR